MNCSFNIISVVVDAKSSVTELEFSLHDDYDISGNHIVTTIHVVTIQ